MNMHVRLLFAAAGIAGLGLFGAVQAGAQDPHGGEAPGHRNHEGERPPQPKWTGVNRIRVSTQSYRPLATYTAYAATPPLMDSAGKPVPPLERGDATPVNPKGPQPGPVAGPSVPPGREPAGPSVELSETEATTYWSNYYEVYRRELLRELRGWKQPAHAIDPQTWKDPVVQQLLKCLLDRDPWVAAEAAVALGATGRPELFPILARLARDDSPASSHIVRSGAILGVGLCPEPRSNAALQAIAAEYNPAALAERQGEQRGNAPGNGPDQPADQRGGIDQAVLDQHEYRSSYALTGMAFTMSPEHLEYLIALVKRNDLPLRMRVAALTAVARQEDPEAVAFMVSMLMSPHLPHQLRGSAAIGIGRTRVTEIPGTQPGTRAGTILLEVLRITGDGSRSTRLGVAAALAYCGQEADLPGMREWINGWAAVPHADPLKATPAHQPEDDTTVRSGFLATMARVARTAGAAEQTATRKILASHTGLNWPSGVRGFAAISLGMLQDPAGVPVLHEVLRRDPDSHVQGAAAVALGLLQDETAVDPLITLLGKLGRNPDKRADAAYVIEGLGLLNSADALAVLRKRFAEAPDQHQRRAAGLALAIAGDATIVPGLVEDLTSDDQWRGPGAALALSYLSGESMKRVLLQAAKSEHASARLAAVKVLGRWVHDSFNPRLSELVAPGVLFPMAGDHLYDDLLIWQ